MHPLTTNIKELSFEELEKRYQEINKRLQKLRTWNQSENEMYYQLQLMKDDIDFEREERFMLESNKDLVTESSIVVNTDPLPDDEDQLIKQKQPPNRQRQYTLL